MSFFPSASVPPAPSPAAHFDAGRQAQAAGRAAEAAAAFGQALALDPGYAPALHQLGLIHADRGELPAAVGLLLQAVHGDPIRADLRYDLGRLLLAQNRALEARSMLESALALQPQFPEALHLLGDACRRQGDLAAAILHYRAALTQHPHFIAARRELGLALQAARDFAGAHATLAEHLALVPGDTFARVCLAYVLLELGRTAEAGEESAQLLAVSPATPEIQLLDAAWRLRIGELETAEASCHRAIALAPANVTAYTHLGAILLAQNRAADSRAVYDTACALQPASSDVRYNRSFPTLALGDFAAGWEDYEHRTCVGAGRTGSPLNVPAWDGTAPLAGRTLLLHCEQGYGDTIQFARYALLARAGGAEVHLAVQRPLLPLFAGWSHAHRVFAVGDPLPSVDLVCPLLSAPRAFRTRLDSIPAPVPYLAASADPAARWRARLGPGVKVGIVWAGNPAQSNDNRRSIALAAFAPLLRHDHVRFFSLQKDPPRADLEQLARFSQLTDLSPHLSDFGETAGVIAALDLVISVDTSVAHLAGALGARVWTLLPFAADWRWLLEREDSPWYPTMRLFRQRTRGDWAEVFARVDAALGGMFPGR